MNNPTYRKQKSIMHKIKKFGKEVTCRCSLYDNREEVRESDPLLEDIFTSPYFLEIERGEEWYALGHRDFKGKVVLVVEMDNWRKAKNDS